MAGSEMASIQIAGSWPTSPPRRRARRLAAPLRLLVALVLVFLAVMPAATAAPLPALTGRVVDDADKGYSWLEQIPAAPFDSMDFGGVPEPKTAKNRVHLDLQPQDCTRDEEVQRLLDLGASVVEDHRQDDGTGWVWLADPEGNDFCVERGAADRADEIAVGPQARKPRLELGELVPQQAGRPVVFLGDLASPKGGVAVFDGDAELQRDGLAIIGLLARVCPGALTVYRRPSAGDDQSGPSDLLRIPAAGGPPLYARRSTEMPGFPGLTDLRSQTILVLPARRTSGSGGSDPELS